MECRTTTCHAGCLLVQSTANDIGAGHALLFADTVAVVKNLKVGSRAGLGQSLHTLAGCYKLTVCSHIKPFSVTVQANCEQLPHIAPS